ncbi:Nuclear pore complex protein NUP1 [Linum grandiflorum]
MAAAARDRKENQPYDDGGGYGKFRKRPYRRRETTPYDRPIPNPGLQSSNGGGNGWLSRFMDPAQRLIASGAHKLFASVFRKRLPSTQQTQPPEPGSGGKQKQREALAKDKQVETVPMVSSKVLVGSQGGTIRIHDGPSSSNGGGVSDLESMLKQKKFTRHEINRLTNLLQSRVVDLPIANEEKSTVVPSNSFLMPGNGNFPITPVKENVVENQIVSTPIVLDQDVASPAELAKAYMGRRPSKVSPSMLGLPNQPWKDDSALQAKHTFRSKGSSTSAINQSSSLAGSKVNGFITPRPRGRSAVYSMARLPYSRTQSTNMIQGAGTSKEALSGREFSSRSALDKNRCAGTRQGTLKRRSSVLDNDIESTSPIRRIRQKSNLMSAAAVLGTRPILETEGQLALTSEPTSEVEQPKENGDYGIQIPGFTPVSTKSSKMASEILQQLDVMVSSREKSPARLSPSMLHGQALRSLDKIDSSKFRESVQDSKTNTRNAGMSDDARCSMPEKEDKLEQNGLSQVDFGRDDMAAKNMEKHNSIDATPANTGIKYADQISKPKNPGFRISADDDEDFLDIDDEEIAASTSTRLEAGDEKLISSSAKEKAAAPTTVDMPPGLFGAKETKIVNGTPVIGNRDTLASLTPSSSGVIKEAAISSQSAAAFDKASLRIEQNGPTKEAPLFSAASLSASPNDGFGMKFGDSSVSQSESSERVVSVASAIDPLAKAKNDKDAGRIEPCDSFQRSEISPPSALASSPAVGMFSSRSGLQNGTLPGPSTFQTVTDSSLSVVPNAGLPTDSSVNDFNTGNKRDSAKTTVSHSGSSIFNFGSPATSNSVPPPSRDAGVGTSQTNKETSFRSSTGIQFVDSKPSITSSGSGLFSIAASKVAGITACSSSSDSLATENKSTFVNSFGATGASSASTGSSVFGSNAASSTVNNNTFPGASTFAVPSTGGILFSAPTCTSTGNSPSNATASSTSSGCNFLSFSAKPLMSSVTNQSQDLNNSIGSDLVAATGLASSTQSAPSQFGSSMSSAFGPTSNTSAASGKSSLIGSSSTPTLFSSVASFGATSSTPSEANTVSSTATTPSPNFGSSWPAPSSSIFGAASNSSASFGGFSLGSSSTTAATGSSTNTTSSSVFSFTAPQSNASKQPSFGGPNSSFPFGSTPSFPSGNNDQTRMEDSMAEDTVQATAASAPFFGQQTVITPPASSSGYVFSSGAPAGGAPQFGSITPSAGNAQFGSTTPSAQFGNPFPSTGNPQFSAGNMQVGSTFATAGNQQFGSTTPSAGNPGNFQFGGQPSAQNGSGFQASGSVEFNAGGGSFSLGTGGGDKSNRRIVKVRRNQRKK